MKTLGISFKLEADLLDRLRRIASANDRTISAEVRQAVRLYVEDCEPKREEPVG